MPIGSGQPVDSDKSIWICFIAGWIAIVTVGMYFLVGYSFRPGQTADAPSEWPESSEIQLSTQYHNLVVVAHPKCSCTRATIAELSKIMTRLQGLVHTRVLFVVPEGMKNGWAETDLWRSAEIIEGVKVVKDPGGNNASKFGALTSGQVYLFSPSGRLLFEGGITPTRSHQGDNVGRRRIVSLVTEGHSDRSNSSVFGCPIEEDDDDYFQLFGLGAQIVRTNF